MSSHEAPEEGKLAAAKAVAPANDGVPDEDHRNLGAIRAETLAALKWYDSEGHQTVEVLRAVCGVLFQSNLLVADLGEAAFRMDADDFEIVFNRRHIHATTDAIRAQFAEVGDTKFVEREALRLLVYHEIEHIIQNFAEHSLAEEMKDAFGADELSKFDLVADVRAAHCNTLVSLASRKQFGKREYLETYRNNLLLSFKILTRGFSLTGDHKKKRALGLLTSAALVQLALEHLGTEREGRFLGFAYRPAFTSVSQDRTKFVVLSCSECGWSFLSTAQVQADPKSVEAMWSSLRDGSPEQMLGILLNALRKALAA